MAAIERLRAGHPDVGHLRGRGDRRSRLILQAMRAGANEFFPVERAAAGRTLEESFHGAVRRTAARRDAATAGARQPCVDARLPRRQGRRRHDDRRGQLRGRDSRA